MKTYIYLILLSFLMTVSSCSKKDNCDNPVDCLPRNTQTGEGTFGCLINGEVFKPGGSQFPGPTQQVFYTFINGGYNFGLSADNRNTNSYLGIALKNQIIEKDSVYQLNSNVENSNFGECVYNSDFFQTTKLYSGEIKFTKFDDINGIVSGTFWFDAINEDGEVVEIREGRFDMKL
jgi:hypothetical protein